MDTQQASQHVIELEQQLLDPATRADVARIDALLHTDFVEHGTSGRIWSRQAVLETLPLEDHATPQVHGTQFRADAVADGAILLTYVSTSTQRTCHRSSLWLESTPGTWQMRFHQGTQTTPAA
ncbi:MAG: ribonuclease HI [Ilumatobacter sp.]